MDILVTNNPQVKDKFQSNRQVDYLDTDVLGIMTHVRDFIHKGHKLLTHPLSGSVKPNETLYKSILISGTPESTDTQSVIIIEESITTAQKFHAKNIPDKYLKDLQTVDLTLISSALEK